MTTTPLAPRPVPVPRGAGDRSGGSDFARLAQRVGAAGLLDRRPGYYTLRLGLVVAALAGGWTAFALLG
ncbi:acyl-CoA desaturase, partial [Streptomyces sp. SID11233]|nr:acyl-CoA desaturase [Streptomyces sp. SID11233]